MYSSLYLVITVSLLLVCGFVEAGAAKTAAKPKHPRRLPAIRKHLVCQATIEGTAMRGGDGVSAIHRPDSAIEMSKNLNAA
jgi:hypothetical protein